MENRPIRVPTQGPLAGTTSVAPWPRDRSPSAMPAYHRPAAPSPHGRDDGALSASCARLGQGGRRAHRVSGRGAPRRQPRKGRAGQDPFIVAVEYNGDGRLSPAVRDRRWTTGTFGTLRAGSTRFGEVDSPNHGPARAEIRVSHCADRAGNERLLAFEDRLLMRCATLGLGQQFMAYQQGPASTLLEASLHMRALILLLRETDG